jgi:hypothetical protein
MPLSYGSIAGNLSSCIQHPSAVFSTTAWFVHVRSRSFSGDAVHIGIISAERQVRQNGRVAAAQLGFDDSALKMAGGRPVLGGDLKFRKLEPGRNRAAAQGV